MSTTQRSTGNISYIRNAPRRVTMPFRPWTRAQCLLNKHGITNRAIADESGVPLATVSRSLSIKHFKRTGFANVLRVRDTCEALFVQKGAAINHIKLWVEYDQAVFAEEK